MKKLLVYFACIALLFSSCESLEHTPASGDLAAPSRPVVTDIESINGGAKITYSIPNDPNILYISAIFESHEGVQREVKASVFNGVIKLEGFGDVSEYLVKLYSVSRAEVKSEPVDIVIQPLEPPIQRTFESLQVGTDFGGVNTRFSNEEEKGFVFYTLIKNEDGKWEGYDRLFTSSKSRNYSVRGFPSEPIDFAFYFRDEWGNISDTLFTNLTPLYEEELDKDLWSRYPLPSDTYTRQGSWTWIEGIWDRDYVTSNRVHYQQTAGAKMPNWQTIDLGKKSYFSRLVVFQHPSAARTYAYNYGTPRLYEVYGSNNPEDSWDSWTLLMECESIKPSGSPIGQRTAEDSAYAAAGENFDFPSGTEAYRYLRFKWIESWTGAQNLMLMEIDLFGQPVE